MKLKTPIKSNLLLAFATTFLLMTSAQADTPAFVLGSVNSNTPTSFTGTKGWSFGRASASQQMTITQLGVFDSGGDGLMNPHQIGLWRSDGTLLASATVPAGTAAPMEGGYRFASISPVVLPTGAAGIFYVAAQFSAGDEDDLVTPIPGGRSPLVFIDQPLGKYGLGENLTFPAFQTSGPCPDCPSPPFWEANFQFGVVPEPSTVLLFGAGALCLLLPYCKPR